MIGYAYMLKHPDGGDLVKITFEQMDILEFHTNPGFKTAFHNVLLCKISLFLRKRYPYSGHAIFLCGITNQRTPAAADIKQVVSGFQA